MEGEMISLLELTLLIFDTSTERFCRAWEYLAAPPPTLLLLLLLLKGLKISLLLLGLGDSIELAVKKVLLDDDRSVKIEY